jgi:hypothetical protein
LQGSLRPEKYRKKDRIGIDSLSEKSILAFMKEPIPKPNNAEMRVVMLVAIIN